MLAQVVVQRGLVDDGAARDVDEDGVVAHPAELAGADETAGRGGERQGEHDHVGVAQHALQVGERADEVDGLAGRRRSC